MDTIIRGKQNPTVLQVPDFLKATDLSEDANVQQLLNKEDIMSEGVVGNITTVPNLDYEPVDTTKFHFKELENKAKAMTLEEQKATARGLDPRVMLDEVARTLCDQETTLKTLKGIVNEV